MSMYCADEHVCVQKLLKTKVPHTGQQQPCSKLLHEWCHCTGQQASVHHVQAVLQGLLWTRKQEEKPGRQELICMCGSTQQWCRLMTQAGVILVQASCLGANALILCHAL